jgi:hypothetical protein
MFRFQESGLVRTMIASLFVAVFAGNWDVWWHGAVGRDSFWEKPHILLYSSVMFAFFLGLYLWLRERRRDIRNLLLALVLIPISGPFDEFWHQFFGREPINDPVIIWSPPHLLLVFGMAASLVMLLKQLERDEDASARQFFGTIAFASLFSLSLFPTIPIKPTGAFELIGFYGAGFIAPIFVGVLFTANAWLTGVSRATSVFLVFLVLQGSSVAERFAEGVLIEPHDHPPFWLMAVAFFVPAAFMDLSRTLPTWLRGGLAAGLWSSLLYGFSSMFFRSEFQYPPIEALRAIVVSVIAGLCVGFLWKVLHVERLFIPR